MTSLAQPVLLRPDNFTPPMRTPWGGRRIVDDLKSGLVEAAAVRDDARVGEAWELSVEPDFPSATIDGRSLDACIRADAHAWLGLAAQRVASTELLVKLLDAEDDLSVQIHPDDAYRGLEAGQGGKPESWYVVAHAPGACLYLGLAEGVDESQLRATLKSGGDIAPLLHRVPVAPGDFFVIEPGTPHAIGRGCLLVEPQRVTPGRKGVTYRFWDWNRRYDSTGRPDPSGTPRPLHVDHALAVTRFDAPRGGAMLERVRHRAGAVDLAGAARLERMGGPGGPAISDALVVDRASGTGSLPITAGVFRGLTVLAGQVAVRHEGGTLVVARGRSAALPATVPVVLELDHAHAIVASVVG